MCAKSFLGSQGFPGREIAQWRPQWHQERPDTHSERLRGPDKADTSTKPWTVILLSRAFCFIFQNVFLLGTSSWGHSDMVWDPQGSSCWVSPTQSEEIPPFPSSLHFLSIILTSYRDVFPDLIVGDSALFISLSGRRIDFFSLPDWNIRCF